MGENNFGTSISKHLLQHKLTVSEEFRMLLVVVDTQAFSWQALLHQACIEVQRSPNKLWKASVACCCRWCAPRLLFRRLLPVLFLALPHLSNTSLGWTSGRQQTSFGHYSPELWIVPAEVLQFIRGAVSEQREAQSQLHCRFATFPPISDANCPSSLIRAGSDTEAQLLGTCVFYGFTHFWKQIPFRVVMYFHFSTNVTHKLLQD
mmetsp:Transcript_63016/g.147990  ORF Transcript_63016/g.147990 Transcript_63016/m.147990 type:complete len:205 (-) Transcript_63016:359-973(-)